MMWASYINEAIIEEFDYLDPYEEPKIFDKYEKIINSNLSILKIWISICKSNQLDIKIKSRINNNFYCSCLFHNASDLSLRIVEDKNAYCCYGCGVGGTIVSLISNFYEISPNESVELLYGYISNDLNSFNKEQLDKLTEIFQYYNLPIAEELFEESRRKTELLNERIKRYISYKDCYFDDEEKIANRLCCAKKYVKRFIPTRKRIDDNELPF